jgi:hypothetical protein
MIVWELLLMGGALPNAAVLRDNALMAIQWETLADAARRTGYAYSTFKKWHSVGRLPFPVYGLPGDAFDERNRRKLIDGLKAPSAGKGEFDIPTRPQLFIMYGESGMVGGEPTGVIPAQGGLMMFGFDGKWKAAYEPTHDSVGCVYSPYNGQHSGYSPGVAFGESIMQQIPGFKVGLIPCARNGRTVQELSFGGQYFTSCMERVAEARKYGDIAGIIISQGINDAVQGVPADVWRPEFERMIEDLRSQSLAPASPWCLCGFFLMRT